MVGLAIGITALIVAGFAIFVEYRLYSQHSKTLKSISDEMHDLLSFQRHTFADDFLKENLADVPNLYLGVQESSPVLVVQSVRTMLEAASEAVRGASRGRLIVRDTALSTWP